MTWRWLRRGERRVGASQATVARRKAEADLRAIRAETPKYLALAESLREMRQRNNFAAAIETSFRGGRGK